MKKLRYVPVSTASRYLSVSPERVRQIVKTNKVRSIRDHLGQIYVLAEDVARYKLTRNEGKRRGGINSTWKKTVNRRRKSGEMTFGQWVKFGADRGWIR